MNPNAALYRKTRQAAAWGIGLSLSLGLIKFFGGFFGHSLALVSDAAHSLIDALISCGLMGALVVAERPADHEHPYGHGRLEAVAGAMVAVLLVMLAGGIAWTAVTTFPDENEVPRTYTLIISIGAALLQEGLYRYTSLVARQSGSGALMATAWDYRLDALGGLAVVIGVMLTKWGGPWWKWADHVAALAIAGTVLWVGSRLLRDNTNDLMDRQAPREILDRVRLAALGVERVLGVETLRVRKAGLEFLVDIHIEVDGELTVEVGHAIAHSVKDRIKQNIPAVIDVLVHVEPHVEAEATNNAADVLPA